MEEKIEEMKKEYEVNKYIHSDIKTFLIKLIERVLHESHGRELELNIHIKKPHEEFISCVVSMQITDEWRDTIREARVKKINVSSPQELTFLDIDELLEDDPDIITLKIGGWHEH